MKRILSALFQNLVLVYAIAVILLATMFMLKQTIRTSMPPLRSALVGTLVVAVVTAMASGLAARARWRHLGLDTQYRAFVIGPAPRDHSGHVVWCLGRVALTCWILVLVLLFCVALALTLRYPV